MYCAASQLIRDRHIKNALGSRVTLSSAFGSERSLPEGYLLSSWRVSRQLPRHYKPGTSLKYANIQLSRVVRSVSLVAPRATPPILPPAPSSRAYARRNVYDHSEIKSTAKILPLIHMWSPLPSVAVASFILDPLQLPLKPARYRCCSSNGGTQD